MNENKYTAVSTDTHKHGSLIADTSILHKTKITVYNYKEEKSKEKEKKRNHPVGHRNSLMEKT